MRSGRRGRGLNAPPPSFIWTRRIVLTLLTVFALVPVYVMISSSLKPLQDVTSTFRWIPSPLTLAPYHDIWYTVPLARYFLNSLIVSSAAAALSALVDGCGPVRALFRVVIPAALPGIIAVTIYAFMTAWGEVLFASVMTNNTTRTLAVGLADYSTQNNVYWNQIMAASLVVSVPVVAGFLLLQRYLVAGLTAGAVK